MTYSLILLEVLTLYSILSLIAVAPTVSINILLVKISSQLKHLMFALMRLI